MARLRRIAAVVAASALVLTGCAVGDAGSSSGGLRDSEDTLRVLAGSEVKDMEPLLEEAAEATGVRVEFEYMGTLEGTELVAAGDAAGQYDALWFPNNRYLSLLPGADQQISSSVKIMASPVVLGLKPSVARDLGWDTAVPTWADIARAAGDGDFTYGMTNPAASNSGFSALVSVATALSGTGSALTDADIEAVTPQLTEFFSAQELTAGSSGWLADTFYDDPEVVDGIVNYESVLKGMIIDDEPISLITPSDGVLTSDYPLTLLSSAADGKRQLFDDLTAWLTTPEIQQRIVLETHRRPAVPGVDTQGLFGDEVLFETPFPNTLSTVNGLISTYLNTARKPAQALFVLDTSGSMSGDRIESLRESLKDLAGADESTAGGFSAFRSRERVTLIPFSGEVGEPTVVDIPESGKEQALEQIRQQADGLSARGGTAIYDALTLAYEQAIEQKEERPDTFVSIVLMTDGENTGGATFDDFLAAYEEFDDSVLDIPTFVVLFGEGDVDELTELAELTGGEVFDALSGDLSGAFREIRGFQ